MAPEYNFKFSVTKDEFADFNEYSLWTAPWLKNARRKRFLTLLLSCLIGTGIAVLSSSKKRTIADDWAMLIVVPIIVSLVTTYVFYANAKNSIRKKVNKFLEKDENANLLIETELTLSGEKIIDINTNSTTTYQWSSIIKYAETANCFYLYLNAANGLIIPKRVFNSPNIVQEVREFIVSKVPFSATFHSFK